MNSTKKAARIAGFWYFVSSLPAPFALIYVPSVFMVMGAANPATATANKIRSSELLFRAGIVAELLSATLFILAGMALYELLKGVNKRNALLMLIFILVSIPISYVNELNRIGALMLANGARFSLALDQSQLDTLVMALLHLHNSGLVLAQIFWGVWLFPFGALVYRSGFLPRILGILLIIAGIGYVADSLTHLLFPAYTQIAFKFMTVAGALGEGSTILWLLIVGAKDQPLAAAAET